MSARLARYLRLLREQRDLHRWPEDADRAAALSLDLQREYAALTDAERHMLTLESRRRRR